MKKALAPLAVLALSTGCMVAERTYDNMDLDPDRFAIPANFTNVVEDGVRPVNARLAGDLGPAMRSLDNVASINGFHDRGFTTLEVVVSNERGSAMALLDIQGGVDHPALRPGERVTFSSYDNSMRDDDLYIGGIACSGDGAYGEWNYDAPLESVDVQVEATDNPEVRRLNFTTVHEGDVATGHVDVVVPN